MKVTQWFAENQQFIDVEVLLVRKEATKKKNVRGDINITAVSVRLLDLFKSNDLFAAAIMMM